MIVLAASPLIRTRILPGGISWELRATFNSSRLTKELAIVAAVFSFISTLNSGTFSRKTPVVDAARELGIAPAASIVANIAIAVFIVLFGLSGLDFLRLWPAKVRGQAC